MREATGDPAQPFRRRTRSRAAPRTPNLAHAVEAGGGKLAAVSDDIEWVLLRSFKSPQQAQMLGEILEQQGITVIVEGAMATGVLPGVESARVMVPKDRLAEAAEAARAFDTDAV